MEHLEQVLKIGARCYDKTKLTPEEKRLLIIAYYTATGDRMKEDCGGCFAKIYAFFLNKSKQIQNQTTMEKLNFRIKDGKRIALHGMATVYTNANLTNDAALDILSRAPKAIDMFSDYPGNWREMAQQYLRSRKNGKAATVAAAAAEVGASAPAAAGAPPAEFHKDEFDIAGMKKKSLEAKTEKELREMCASFEMEPATYEKAKKPALIKMLLTKIG